MRDSKKKIESLIVRKKPDKKQKKRKGDKKMKIYDVFSEAFEKKATKLDKSLIYWAKRENNFSCDTDYLREKLTELWDFYSAHNVENMFFDVLAECPERTNKIWDSMVKADEEKRLADYINETVYKLAESGKKYLTKAELFQLINDFYGYEKKEILPEYSQKPYLHYWDISVYKDKTKKPYIPNIPFLAR